MNLFHITDADLVERIKQQGLLPGQQSRFDGSKVEPHKACVYLSDSSKTCALRAGLGSDDIQYGDYAVLVIDGDRLDPDLFRPDEDYLRKVLKLTPAQARESVDVYADLRRDSLSKFHSVAYKGEIPPEAIWQVMPIVKSRTKSDAYYRKLMQQRQEEYEQWAKEYDPCTGERREVASL
jgi:hypothetical protein